MGPVVVLTSSHRSWSGRSPSPAERPNAVAVTVAVEVCDPSDIPGQVLESKANETLLLGCRHVGLARPSQAAVAGVPLRRVSEPTDGPADLSLRLRRRRYGRRRRVFDQRRRLRGAPGQPLVRRQIRPGQAFVEFAVRPEAVRDSLVQRHLKVSPRLVSVDVGQAGRTRDGTDVRVLEFNGTSGSIDLSPQFPVGLALVVAAPLQLGVEHPKVGRDDGVDLPVRPVPRRRQGPKTTTGPLSPSRSGVPSSTSYPPARPPEPQARKEPPGRRHARRRRRNPARLATR